MLHIALFLLLLLVLTSCEPVAEDNPEQLDTTSVGDKDEPDTIPVGKYTARKNILLGDKYRQCIQLDAYL